ncbi:MAG: amidohydrolase family protein [Pirellulaceae bacterium]|nr:amidohydrolase family protein [Pirellulaceae bacterium]
MNAEAIRIQADAILVSPTVLYRPGQIVVRHGRIVSCTADCSEPAALELPGSMLSAGLVNAHTHLEFSDLSEPFAAGSNFPEWIGSVIRHRRKIAENNSSQDYLRLRQAALRNGFEESSRAGVALIGDIVTRPWSPSDLSAEIAPPLATAPVSLPVPLPGALPTVVYRHELEGATCLQHLLATPSVFAFPEMIGLDEPRFIEAAQWATELAAIPSPTAPIWKIGLSPHSPYSIHFPTAVTELAARFAQQQVTAMHVAESLDEREWLEAGTGPFRSVFERLGVPADAPRASISEIVRWLASFQRALLIHGNYLNEAETDLVARGGITIVYCPRTHRHFGHAEYPLRRFINSGINVVLGTDSRASTPDLDLWNEVIAIRQSHPWVDPQWAYAAVTERAAAALGVASDFGTLQVGRCAAINVSHLDRTVAESEWMDELTTRTHPFIPLVELLRSPAA